MTTIEALLLGIIQGLTEFLPVSSSGHLVIFQHLFGIKEAPLTFDILVHMGTLLAVFIAFWTDIAGIIRRPFDKLTYLILIGIIPAGLAGYFFADIFAKAFESLLVVGLGLIFTGFVLIVSERVANRRWIGKNVDEMSYKDALFIGLLQALAIFPGISRSGSTIAAGLLAGLDREFAARFSFLLSIPVILGAGVFQLKDAVLEGLPQAVIVSYTVGTVAAAIFGYLAIILLLRLVRGGKLSYFSYYCWGLAAITLATYYL